MFAFNGNKIENGQHVCHLAGIWHEADKWFGCHKWDQLVCLTTFSLVGRGTDWTIVKDLSFTAFKLALLLHIFDEVTVLFVHSWLTIWLFRKKFYVMD